MLLRRFFKRARTRSVSDTNKQTCLCTTAKRDSLYDDPIMTNNERQSADHYGFIRTDKPRRIIRQINIDESDGEDDGSITEKLRCASSQSPANIPMLVVLSFNPDAKGLQRKQIEIQRGFPVNAQYILNEWLFIKTADNEEGFVPYLCCRPILRRQSTKCSNHMENSYKPYNFQLNKKRQDVALSSCGGDSGVSDCESSSNTFKKTGLIVKDLPLKKLIKINQIKSQLSVSSNSAFTQIKKKNQRQESNQRLSLNPNIRPFPYNQEMQSSFLKSSFHSYDETTNSSSKYPIDNNNIISSPYIRRTPFARRSLPYHHTQSTSNKLLSTKLSSSPDSFQTIKEQQLRNIVLSEPTITPSKSILERQFSDLSLNQIENDSLSPSTPLLLVHNRPSLSCSSSSTASSSTDSSSTPFIHIQMNNYQTGRIPVIYASPNLKNNSNTQSTKSSTFIHNVSITV